MENPPLEFFAGDEACPLVAAGASVAGGSSSAAIVPGPSGDPVGADGGNDATASRIALALNGATEGSRRPHVGASRLEARRGGADMDNPLLGVLAGGEISRPVAPGSSAAAIVSGPGRGVGDDGGAGRRTDATTSRNHSTFVGAADGSLRLHADARSLADRRGSRGSGAFPRTQSMTRRYGL